MLSTEQINQHLGRITYRPHWEITAYEGRWEGQHLHIRATVENTVRPGEQTVLDVHSFIPPMRNTAQLEEFVLWRLIRCEIHEAREHFRRDGTVVFNPHAAFASRDMPAFGS